MKRFSMELYLLMSIMVMFFSACDKNTSDEPPTPEPEVKVGDIFIYTMLANPGGQTGAGWIQLMDGMSS